VQNSVDRPSDIDVLADIMLDELKTLVAKQMGDIIQTAGDEVVHAHYLMSFGNEAIAQM
jgi:hypothetical protein